MGHAQSRQPSRGGLRTTNEAIQPHGYFCSGGELGACVTSGPCCMSFSICTFFGRAAPECTVSHIMVTSPQVSWLFFKAVRAGLAVEVPISGPFDALSLVQGIRCGSSRGPCHVYPLHLRRMVCHEQATARRMDSYGSSEQRGKTANWPRPGGLR